MHPDYSGELFDNNKQLHSITPDVCFWIPDESMWFSDPEEGIAIYHTLNENQEEQVIYLESNTDTGYVSMICFARDDKTPVGGFIVHDDSLVYSDENGVRLFQTENGLILIHYSKTDTTMVMYPEDVELEDVVSALQGKVSSKEVVH